MITIGYSTKSTKPEFTEYLIKSSGFKKVKVIEKINNGEKSLAQVYNEILDESETDIVVLCHDDIYFDSSAWFPKITKHFEKSDYGILGVAGTTYMPKSGMWWEDRKKMIGIVNHESGGKKWESKYSEAFGNGIEPSIVVDGLFIAIHKKRIKKKFNEDFEGFHFYDIPFSFENFLEGVKVGVISNIRITHKSIGQTNEQWEQNRQKFEKMFSENLPVKLAIDRNKKLKVLISCLMFRTFTGSELYVYELAKSLTQLNCSVTILSQIGGPLNDMARKLGIRVLPFEQAPGFKLGDGNWGIQTEKGFEPSKENVMYRVSEVDFDIIHIQHKPVAERICSFYPEIPKIYSIHSEVISLEEPHLDETIKKFIAIRPEIKTFLIENFEVKEENIEIIYNPIDNEKFNSNGNKEGNYVLFVGTIDYLRKDTLMELSEYCDNNGLELWIVGEDKSNYLPLLLNEKHVKHFPATWNVEKYIKNCKETAGIQLGRSTIEGWLCGKPGWIFKVNSNGFILEKEKFDPPQDLEKYYSSKVAEKIKEEYFKIIS
jgi:glycosyltransferase involved in cell wall biosynthesis